ncbi:tetratricopeptide repeat protein 39B isoform X2 [Piliocolobus tephrosceles]|uniref:tetratricopeptide repeat protein 39B isoform X2 n=1 Tax=Piliocolobus tephrosceles TaxID=591936 RepID=UPI001300EF2D|nr:tetratricopeptide repeat protein 39B isoform X2 [Piliocolobus tephrosceles]
MDAVWACRLQGRGNRVAALRPRPRRGGRAGPSPFSLPCAGLSPEPRAGVGSEFPAWFLGGSSRRRNMALVGSRAELEADEDIFEDALETISISSRSDMATSSLHFASCDTQQASRQRGASTVNSSSSTKVDLKSGLEECAVALNLFLSNKFTDALELLRPWAKESMYHALGYSTIVVLQAVLTFEQQDIQNGISAMKDALQTCQKYRKKYTVVESFSSLLSRGSLEQLSEEEMHAEICYAECLLQKAALTFVQDENMINFIKGGLKIRTSYQIYKDCLSILHEIQKNKLQQEFFYEFEGGVKLGTGAFNLMLSLLPARIIRLLEFIGFSGNRAQEVFRKCVSVQEEWKQFHHLCYWELMWINVFQQNWMQAYYYSDLLCKESKWSKATYVFLKAAILSMLPEEDVVATNENVVTLFRQVDSLKQRIAGKSLPTEKFAVRKARRYSASLPAPVKLILPALEMMYVWNGFSIVCKRKDLSENLLVTVEKAEAALQSQNFNNFSVDDECLVKLLKGCCLKNLQRPLQAELCYNHVMESEKLLKYDHYLVPFTLFELASLYKSQGEIDRAIKFLETARNNYKDYSLESRLHFRIQAALHLWRKPSSD